MKARSCIALLMIVTLGMSGCATLFASGPDVIPVQTNPPGAWVYVNGMVVGQTPTMISLSRDRPGQIQIYLPGFQPVMMYRTKGLNGWFIANILWVYVIVPVIVDLVTGNWQRYDDDPILIGLTPAAGAAPPSWYQQQQPQQQGYPQQQPPQGYPQQQPPQGYPQQPPPPPPP